MYKSILLNLTACFLVSFFISGCCNASDTGYDKKFIDYVYRCHNGKTAYCDIILEKYAKAVYIANSKLRSCQAGNKKSCEDFLTTYNNMSFK